MRRLSPGRTSGLKEFGIVGCLVLSAFLFTTRLVQAYPSSITYQGSIKQAGVPYNGSVSIELRLTNADGTQLYWTSGAQSVTVTEGLYRMELAPTCDLRGIDPYIETKINNTVLLPREKLTAAPYASFAKQIEADSILSAGNGTVNGPSYSFSSDPAAGMYLSLPGELSFATTSTQRWKISHGDLTSVNSSIFLNADGYVGTPSYSFVSDRQTGFYLSAPGELSMASNWTQRWKISHGDLTSVNGSNVFTTDGYLGYPSFSFASDHQTGMYLSGIGRLNLVAAGTSRVSVADSGITLNGNVNVAGNITRGGLPAFFVNVSADDCGWPHPYLGCPAGFAEAGRWKVGTSCSGSLNGQGYTNGNISAGWMVMCVTN